jgi:hypothetical protein
LPALRDKATASVNDSSASRCRFTDDTAHDKFHKRNILALEGVTLQFSLAIKLEHLIHKASDLVRNSIAKLNDCIDHTHSMTGEAWQAVTCRIIEHAGELRPC